MSRILIILIFMFFFTTIANAEVVESWICQESSNGDWSKIIATVEVNKGKENGKVDIFGESHIATFGTIGTNKSWKYGSSYEFVFMIKPNGEAMYYDYSKATKGDDVKPQITLFCKEKEIVKEDAPNIKIKLPEDKSEHI
ncbi:hypothetical protein [Geopsychrobacter electrodiphilus]|uniref:hypothetical protein n=1 Tax=Geopsychrobacter electrodiphilus TaxID=225196 RepID=UPI00036FD007|nr:hypothetical protein [Geopsychrobacter electrodiphilus]